MQVYNVNMATWYTSKIYKGNQIGRTITVPTINLDPDTLPQDFKQGVYAALVTYNGKIYTGALYFGPRLLLGETKNVLEINLLDFDADIYGETVSFQVKNFIRGIKNFTSMEAMQKQIGLDIDKIRSFINNTKDADNR